MGPERRFWRRETEPTTSQRANGQLLIRTMAFPRRYKSVAAKCFRGTRAGTRRVRVRPRVSEWDEEWERIGNGHDRRMSNVRKVVEREGGRGRSHRLREIIYLC